MFFKSGSYGTNAKYYLKLDYGTFGMWISLSIKNQHRELSDFEKLWISRLWPGRGTSVLQEMLSFTLVASETLFYTALLYSITALPGMAVGCVTWISSLSVVLRSDNHTHSHTWNIIIKCLLNFGIAFPWKQVLWDTSLMSLLLK